MSLQTVELDAEQLLKFIQDSLPFLETAIPAIGAAGGPIGAGVSAAAALLPLINLIPNGLITIEAQAALQARVLAITTQFSGPEWQPRS